MTPEQIQQAQEYLKSTGYVPPVSSGQPMNAYDRIDAAMTQQKADSASQSPETPGSEGGISGFAKQMVEAPATMLARPLQAASDLGDYLGTNIEADKAREQGDTAGESAILGADAQREQQKQTETSMGGTVAPIPTDAKGVMQDAGRGLETVALGVPGGGSLLSKALSGAASGYAMDVGSKLEQGDTNVGDIATPGAGTITGGTLPFASKLLGSLATHIAGFTAGTGADVIKQAIANPNAVGDAVSKYATTPEAKQTLVDKAKAAISSFIQDKQEEYGNSLNKLSGATNLQEGQQSVVSSFKENVAKFGGSVSDEGTLTFKNSTLTATDQDALKSGLKVIQSWDDTSVKGLDGLRQAIKNHMDEFSLNGNSRANVVLGNVVDDLKSNLSKNVPGYSDMLRTYSEKSQTTKELVKELGLGGNAKPSTQLNNVMRIFQKDQSLRDKLTKVMGEDGSKQFLNELSGAVLSDWLPQGKLMPLLRGGAEVGAAGAAAAAGGAPMAIPTAIAGLAAASPRIVGTVARVAGKAKQKGLGTAATRIASEIASKQQSVNPSNR